VIAAQRPIELDFIRQKDLFLERQWTLKRRSSNLASVQSVLILQLNRLPSTTGGKSGKLTDYLTITRRNDNDVFGFITPFPRLF
jgi:hypothetical protein